MKYQVYEEDDLVFEGSRVDMCKFFNVRESYSFNNYYEKDSLFKGKYRIVLKEEAMQQAKYEHACLMLEKYGNTCMNRSNTELIEMLKEKYDLSVRRVYDLDEDNDDIIDYYYILEVKNGN